MLEGTNLAYALDERQVVRVNDNAERLFAFRSVRGAAAGSSATSCGVYGIGRRRQNRPESGAAEVALASRRQDRHPPAPTRPSSTQPAARSAVAFGSPIPAESSLYARAAFYSWGHLLRLAACYLLDVEPRRAGCGCKASDVWMGGETAYEVVLMDTLENGSGLLPRHLSEPGPLSPPRLGDRSRPRGLAARGPGGEHATACDGSHATDCLRRLLKCRSARGARLAARVGTSATATSVRADIVGRQSPLGPTSQTVPRRRSVKSFRGEHSACIIRSAVNWLRIRSRGNVFDDDSAAWLLRGSTECR